MMFSGKCPSLQASASAVGSVSVQESRCVQLVTRSGLNDTNAAHGNHVLDALTGARLRITE